MKIIFLDMDGVLCTWRSHLAQGDVDDIWHMAALDREAIAMLNKIVDKEGDTKYVLSSTWRKSYDKEWMETHLRRYGWTGEFHADWKTPDFTGATWTSMCRGDEIKDWLDRHIEAENYVILDDSTDMLDSQKANFVNTHVDDGFLTKHYHRTLSILGQEQ